MQIQIFIPGYNTSNFIILGAVNGSAKLSEQAAGMSWELNVEDGSGNNYGPTGFEITGSGVSTGTNLFTINTGAAATISDCNISFNANDLIPLLDANGVVVLTFTARATDDGGEYVQDDFVYKFDFNACRTWTVTLPQESPAQDYIINTFECAGAYNSSCSLLEQTFTSSPSGATQFNFCSKANCADPTPKAGSPTPQSISPADPSTNPCLPIP